MALAEVVAVSVQIAVDEHVAERPSWDCRTCGKPWPCNLARELLTVEMDRVQLAMYMWTHLEEAVGDLRRVSSLEFFQRFISWTDM